jgi:hypothetical protein
LLDGTVESTGSSGPVSPTVAQFSTSTDGVPTATGRRNAEIIWTAELQRLVRENEKLRKSRWAEITRIKQATERFAAGYGGESPYLRLFA